MKPKQKTRREGTTKRTILPKFKAVAVSCNNKVKRLQNRVKLMASLPGMPPMVFMYQDVGSEKNLHITGTKSVCKNLMDKAESISNAFGIETIMPGDERAPQETVDLRQVDLTIQVDQMRKDDLRLLYTQLIINRNEKGSRSVWGNDDKRPQWFPHNILFQSPSHVHKKDGKKHRSVTVEHMREAVSAFIAYCKKALSKGLQPINALDVNKDLIEELHNRSKEDKSEKDDMVEEKNVKEDVSDTSNVTTHEQERETKSEKDEVAEEKHVKEDVSGTSNVTTHEPEKGPSSFIPEAVDPDFTKAILYHIHRYEYEQVADLLKRHKYAAASVIWEEKGYWKPHHCMPVSDLMQSPNLVAQKNIPEGSYVQAFGQGSLYELIYPEYPLLLQILCVCFALEHLIHYVKQYKCIGYIEEQLPNFTPNTPIEVYLEAQAWAILEGKEGGFWFNSRWRGCCTVLNSLKFSDKIQLMFMAGFMGASTIFYAKEEVLSMPPCPCISPYVCLDTLKFCVEPSAVCLSVEPSSRILRGKKKRKYGTESEPIVVEESSYFPGVSSRPIIKWQRFHLYARSLSTLEDTQWLDDAIVDFFLSYFSHNEKSVCAIPSVMAQKLIVRKNQTSMQRLQLTGYNYEDAKEYIPKDISFANVFLLPVCDNSHWWLYVTYRREKVCHTLCSLRKRNRTISENVCKFFTEYFGEEVELKWAPVPLQANGFDCGVHAIFSAREIISDPFKEANWSQLFKSRTLQETGRNYLKTLLENLK